MDDVDVVVRLNGGLALAQAPPDVMSRRTDVPFYDMRAAGAGMVAYPSWRRSAVRAPYRAKGAELRRDGGPPIRGWSRRP